MEVLLVLLERDAVFSFITEDRHTAFEEVNHDIFQFGHIRFGVNFIELDVIIFDYLELDVFLAS